MRTQILNAIGWHGMMTGHAAPTAYLSVINAFTLPHLLPMSDRDKNVQILALQHQAASL